jgi:hypothetical protein
MVQILKANDTGIPTLLTKRGFASRIGHLGPIFRPCPFGPKLGVTDDVWSYCTLEGPLFERMHGAPLVPPQSPRFAASQIHLNFVRSCLLTMRHCSWVLDSILFMSSKINCIGLMLRSCETRRYQMERRGRGKLDSLANVDTGTNGSV